MARTGAWSERLTAWLTVPRSTDPGTSSPPGPWGKLLGGTALVGILIWGFGGSWELPSVEIAATSGGGAPVVRGGLDASRTVGAGAELFEVNGCAACHALDGAQGIGPSLRGIYGKTVELSDGRTVLVDDTYLVESVLEPAAKRVAGFDDVAMPSYEGLVTDEDVRALAAYIKELE
jgi:mono/diheme cytochrome c family protein